MLTCITYLVETTLRLCSSHTYITVLKFTAILNGREYNKHSLDPNLDYFILVDADASTKELNEFRDRLQKHIANYSNIEGRYR